MGIAEIVGLLTVIVPPLTGLLKKVLPTKKWEDKHRKRVHALAPLLVGVAAGIVACVSGACDVAEVCGKGASLLQCALGGLAAGAGGSYVRDFDKNVLGIAKGGAKIASVIVGRKKETPSA